MFYYKTLNTDMVDSCQEEKSILSNCFPAVLVVDRFQGTQRGGTLCYDGWSLWYSRVGYRM